MPMSSATTGRSAMTGSTSTCSGRTTRYANTQRAGSGLTITKGQTWPWVASPRNRSWPSWPRLYFWAAPKKGGLPQQEQQEDDPELGHALENFDVADQPETPRPHRRAQHDVGHRQCLARVQRRGGDDRRAGEYQENQLDEGV